MSHTKGPWKLRDGIISNDRQIAKIHYEYVRYGMPARAKFEAEDDANARLIAAAPDLLEACKLALAHFNARQRIDEEPILAALRAAIAKAQREGE